MAPTTMPMYAPGQARKRNVNDVLEILDKDQDSKNILVRVDFNVPMDDNGKITDDSRIRGAIPTIDIILKSGNNAILMSHMGRPKKVQKGEDDGTQRAALSLNGVLPCLKELTGADVRFVDDCIGEKVKAAVAALPKSGGSILVLENLRFRKDEELNVDDFAQELASIADAYINDAFGTAHRAHASVTGVPALLPKERCGVGCLIASEVAYLDFSQLGEGEKIAAIIGGSKVSTKLPVITGLVDQVHILVLGGGLAYTFAKANGIKIGTSLCEDNMIETAKTIIADAKKKGVKLLLPVDAVAYKSFPSGPMSTNDTKTFDLVVGSGIDEDWMGLDVGPKTLTFFKEGLSEASKIIFNGPMGVFEIEPFDTGTKALVDVLEESTKQGAITVVGGGDSVAALEKFGKTNAVSYVSTGGGATLELLAGDILPGVAAISDVEE
jgi:phosphoglycerate kinase